MLNWALQCWTTYSQRVKQDSRLAEAVTDATEICCAEHNVRKDAYRTPKGVEKQLDFMVDRKYLSCSRDAEANEMIHMRIDHRSVMAQFVTPSSKKEDSHKARITWKKLDNGDHQRVKPMEERDSMKLTRSKSTIVNLKESQVES